jgi:WD40 repeat protein
MNEGKKLISSSFDKSIGIWDVATGRLERSLWHDDLVVDLSISPDEQKIASAGYDRVVRVWNAATGDPLHLLEGHNKSVLSTAFSPDGKWIASGGQDHSLKLWDAATGKLIRTLIGHSGAIWDLKFDKHGRRIASGGRDSTARVWDAETGRQLLSFSHDDWVSSVAFNSKERQLFTGTKNGEISVWDLQTSKKLAIFSDNNKWVYGLEISPDGRYLASCSRDQSVRLWRIDTRELLLTLNTPHCYRVDFSADGRQLAFGYGKSVRVIPLDLSNLERSPAKVLSGLERQAGQKLEGFLLRHLSADAFGPTKNSR